MQLVVRREAHPRSDFELSETGENHIQELAPRLEDGDDLFPGQRVPEKMRRRLSSRISKVKFCTSVSHSCSAFSPAGVSE